MVTGAAWMTAWLPEMLQHVEVELQRYERIINYWPMYAPAPSGDHLPSAESCHGRRHASRHRDTC